MAGGGRCRITTTIACTRAAWHARSRVSTTIQVRIYPGIRFYCTDVSMVATESCM
jgi:hypothetical protein